MRRSPPLLVLLAACAADPKAPGPAAAAVDTAVEPAPEWVPPDQTGPYGVGFTTLEWTDDRGKELTADVWYPAQLGADDVPSPYSPTTLTISAVRDAPLDLRGGPYPLIAFSHGFGGIRFQSAFLMEHLASHGWVLVSPDHENNTFMDLDQGETGRVVVERPGDIRAAVDHLLAWSGERDDGWAGAVDGSRYAMLGHSFGALTSLVVGGGSVDFTDVTEMCDSGEVRGMACNYVPDVDPDAIRGTQEADPRAEVIVPMSPGVWYGFGREGEGLQAAAPSLVLGGEEDGILGYDTEIRPTWEALAAPRTLASYARAGHLVFSDICLIAPFLSPECEGGEDWISMDEAHAVTKTLVTAWLDVHFLGEERGAAWLSESALGDPDFLTLESVSR